MLAVLSVAAIGSGLMINTKTPPPSQSGCGPSVQRCSVATRANAAIIDKSPGDHVPAGLGRVIGDDDLAKDLATLFGVSLTIIVAIVGLHRDHHYKQIKTSSD